MAKTKNGQNRCLAPVQAADSSAARVELTLLSAAFALDLAFDLDLKQIKNNTKVNFKFVWSGHSCPLLLVLILLLILILNKSRTTPKSTLSLYGADTPVRCFWS